MRRLNPAYVEKVCESVNTSPYFTLISMKLKELGRTQSLLEVAVQEKHLQPFGNIHGGVCASLVDAAAFWAVYTDLDAELGLTSVELKLNYLAPISRGRLIAKGSVLKVGKTICLGEGSISDENGKPIAHGTSTMMILRELNIRNVTELPVKFLGSPVPN